MPDYSQTAQAKQKRRNLERVGENPGALLGGLSALPGTIGGYLADRARNPRKIPSDASFLGGALKDAAMEDPGGFVADMALAPISAARDVAELREMARQARARGDKAGASNIEQLAAGSMLGAIPVAGAVIKRGLSAARKPAKAAAKSALTVERRAIKPTLAVRKATTKTRPAEALRVPEKVATPTREDNLRAFMARSHAVGEKGAPMRLYRGDNTVPAEGYDTSGGSGRTHGTGVWFSSDPDIAATYARGPTGGNLAPVYLNAQNPLEVHAYGSNWNDLGADSLVQYPDGTQDALGDLLGFYEGAASTDDAARLARRLGHDSLVVRDVVDRGGVATYGTPRHPSDVWVAFEPNSVKSAVGNRGTFDPREVDITKRRGGLAVKKKKR